MNAKRKKIGFVQEDPDVEDNNATEDPFLKMFMVNKAMVKQFIENSFSPFGDTTQREYKTSAELVYMLREFEEPSMKIINEVMNELNYKMQFIEKVPHWVVYMKQSDEYPD